MDLCGWVYDGFKWVCDGTCDACPEEEVCSPPPGAGATGDRKRTDCLPPP